MDQGQCHDPGWRSVNRLCCVFDLDGTLLDTLADIAAACNTVLARHGYPQHPLAAYAAMVGDGFAMLLRRAAPRDRPPDQEELAALTKEARAVYAGRMTAETRPYPQMPETLAMLAEQGKNLGVLSNKPDNLVCGLIAHYFPDIPFWAVRGALPDQPLKPDPACLLAMLAKAGATAAEACYIGDSNVDMLTAKNAATAGIGAAWGFRGEAELLAAGATLVINQPQELLSLTIPA